MHTLNVEYYQINLFSSESRIFTKPLTYTGGGGGKGTWGKLGCELELPWVDPKDPNYESDGDENIVNDAPAHVPTKNGGQPHGQNGNIKSHAHGTTLKTMVPEMSEEDVNRGKRLKAV